MLRGAVLGGEFHELLGRRSAQFGGAPHGDLVLGIETDGEESGSLDGRIVLIWLPSEACSLQGFLSSRSPLTSAVAGGKHADSHVEPQPPWTAEQ